MLPRTHTVSLFCILLALSGAALADEDMATAPVNPLCCGTSYHPTHISARHIEGNGIGYSKGYTTVEGFFSTDSWDNWVPFLDARGHVFNDGKLAANAGIGTRYLSDSIDWVLGANLYYDWRNTKRKSYSQIGIGLEALSSVWELRTNGYIPVSSRKSRRFGSVFKNFQGNNIILQQKQDLALYGVDAEAGAHLMKCDDFDVFAGIGPYYFAGSGAKDFFGGKFRLNGKWKEYIALEGTVSYDRVFRDIYQGQITFSLPLGKTKGVMKRSCNTCCSSIALDRRLVQPVVRDEIIVVERRKRTSVAINPATGLPFNVLFVSNLSSSLGTFESPYSTLLAAQNASHPDDILYVLPGDGTSRNLDAGITLKNGQQLLGSSSLQTINTSLGFIDIPAQTTTLVPTLANTLGTPIVTAANNNVISGFTFQNNDFALVASGISGLTFKGNLLTINDEPLQLTNVGGQLIIANNIFQAVAGDPIMQIISLGINNAFYSITNNTVFASSSGTAGASITLTNCSNLSTEIIGNNFLTDGTPLIFQSTNVAVPTSPNSLLVVRNNLSSRSANLVITLAQNAATSLQIFDNVLDSANSSNLALTMGDSTQTALSLSTNTLFNGFNAVVLTTNNSSNLAAIIENNTFRRSTENNKILANVNASSAVACSINGNTFYPATEVEAVRILPAGTSLSAWNVSNNTVLGGGEGISFRTTATASCTGTVVNNLIAGVDSVGIRLQGDSSLTNVWNVQNNLFNTNLSLDFLASNSAGSTCLTFQHNNAVPITGSFGDPVYRFSQTGGTFNLAPLVDNLGVPIQLGTITPVSSCN